MLETDGVAPPASGVSSRPVPWGNVALVLGLLVVAYLPILIRMANQWTGDDDMGHGFFVPAIAGYIAWNRRREVLALTPRPNLLGLLLMLWAAVQMSIGILGAELFLQRSAFVASVWGSVLFLGGWPYVRALALPLVMLPLMVPIPAVIYNQITFPLQLFASSVAENVLILIGIPVLRDGNVLELANQKLSVVEACSGIRSLLSLTFLSLVYGYFSEDRLWVRWAIFLASIPIAVAANSFRVSATGIISEYNPDLAQGFFHTLEGGVSFAFAFCLMLLFHVLVKKISPAPSAGAPVTV
ncbi:MAG TPA: exosortase/archaeosortase family protein [Bryobacteraceae bacterium]|nr:exosortase/archaeosortase family protein [Bryobacteraceae bacterium]